jgi:hypothetical protein
MSNTYEKISEILCVFVRRPILLCNLEKLENIVVFVIIFKNHESRFFEEKVKMKKLLVTITV